jgi:hypothetical protein
VSSSPGFAERADLDLKRLRNSFFHKLLVGQNTVAVGWSKERTPDVSVHLFQRHNFGKLIGFCMVGLIGMVVVVIAGLRNLDKARLPSRAIYAIQLGKELAYTTNSTRLMGASADFKADLAKLVEFPAWPMLDRPPTDGSRGSILLVLTNDHGQALHLRLHGDFSSGGWRFRLLGYQKFKERTD